MSRQDELPVFVTPSRDGVTTNSVHVIKPTWQRNDPYHKFAKLTTNQHCIRKIACIQTV